MSAQQQESEEANETVTMQMRGMQGVTSDNVNKSSSNYNSESDQSSLSSPNSKREMPK